MVAEDVPSYKIVNGQPAEPLLTRIVQPRDRRAALAAGQGRAAARPGGELMAVSVIEDVTEAKEAELRQRFLAQAGVDAHAPRWTTRRRCSASRSSSCPAWPTGARSTSSTPTSASTRSPSRTSTPTRSPSRASSAAATRPTPTTTRGIYGVLRSGRPELYPELPDELLAQSIADPEQLEAIRALGMRSVMLIPMVVAGRTIGVLTMVSAESGRSFDEDDLVFAGDLARRAATAVENARLYTERAAGRAHAPGEPAARAAADHAGLGAGVVLRGRRHDGRGRRRLLRRRRARRGLPGRRRRRHRQGRAGRGPDRAGAPHAGHRGALRPQPRGGRRACSTTSSSIARRSRCSPSRARTWCPSDAGARLRLTSAGHPLPVLSRPGQRADDDRAARAAAGHDRRGALGAERDRAAPRRHAALLHRRRHRHAVRAASASARSACSPPCPTHRPSRAR